MIEPYAFNGVVTTDHENQSLPGVVHRLLTESPSFSDYVDDVYTPREYHNFLSLDPAIAGVIVKSCMLIFGLAVLWVCRSSIEQRQRWQLAAEFSLILIGMLLFSERTWKHHCVTLLLPFSVLCYYVAACKPGPAMKRFVISALIAAALLMASTSTGWSAALERFGKLTQVYGAYVWANLLLSATLMVVLRQEVMASRLRMPKGFDGGQAFRAAAWGERSSSPHADANQLVAH